ncbi:MAG: nuclear transport factor 2 family protein [Gemmatimonadaceae bacterium]
MRAALLIVATLLPVVAAAQSARPVPDTANARQQIIALEERIGQANFDCDYRFFAEVEADEFIFTDAGGGITTRAEDLAGESNCKRVAGTYALSDVRVMLYGASAVFNAIATTTTTRDGAQVVRKQRFTDVLVWRAGRWQLVAGHSSRIPPPKSP